VRQASELAALPIPLSGGRRVRLDQIATVEDAVAERAQAALRDGEPVVGFRVYRTRGADETRVADGVDQTLKELAITRPDLKTSLVTGSVEYTREQFRGSMHMLFEGAALAVIVVFLFLRDWRATFIAAAALPLSILPAFAGMAILGFSLNMLTLLALSVIVGILVDDAIVEIENIERHGRMGKPIRRATEDAVNEIALAVIATTMTLVAVFLPTALMGGIPGRFFREFGWTTVIAVLSSLLVARLLTPMMAASMLKALPPKAESDGFIMRNYLIAVRWCLAHRKSTLAASVLFLIASFAMLPFINVGLFPVSDRGQVTVEVDLPPGSTLQNTLRVSEQARMVLKDIPGVETIFTIVGGTRMGGDGGSAGEVRRSSLNVTLTPRGDREPQTVIEAAIREKLALIPGARFSFNADGPGSKMQLILASDDTLALKATAQAFERELRGLGTVFNIQSTASLERPEIVIRPDLEKAAERGVTTAAIGETVRIATSGDFDTQVARLNLDNRQVYIRLRIPEAARRDIATIANLRVAGRNGLVPLSSIATISMDSGPSQIDRYDRRRYITVGGDLGGSALGEVLTATEQLPSIKNRPANVHVIRTGDTEIAGELQSGFGMAVVVGLLCVFGVLVLLFKDFLQPVTILSAIPLSIGGVLFAMLVARTELNMPAMIGFVMLMGIVTKNSILLVEYAILNIRERAMSVSDALVDACHKRARPIVMTTVAMSAGMMPLALGFGADAAFRQSMAVAVIGGLLTSTVLSLLVVPVVFVYIDRFEHFLRRTFRRSAQAHAPAE
jgi:multidrug efflux pump subunit AcrB